VVLQQKCDNATLIIFISTTTTTTTPPGPLVGWGGDTRSTYPLLDSFGTSVLAFTFKLLPPLLKEVYEMLVHSNDSFLVLYINFQQVSIISVNIHTSDIKK